MPPAATLPRSALLALEAPRAFGELGLVAAAQPLLAFAARGDGHSVLVMPGLAASDRSTQVLRGFLRRLGYDVHGWGLGRNAGPTAATLDAVGRRFADLHARDGKHISVIGWSMGGIFARRLARLNPDAVRQVITLGSPFRMMSGTSSSSLETPATAIYSRSDGIAPWRSCFDDGGPRSESVEVVGSHCGLGHHPAVLHVIADRLAQPEGEWQPFTPRGLWAPFFPSTTGSPR